MSVYLRISVLAVALGSIALLIGCAHDAKRSIGPSTVLAATTLPANTDFIPPLYVFDENAELHLGTLKDKGLSNRVLEKANGDAFYGRVEGYGWHFVPYVDKDLQVSMVGDAFNFHAPPGGLLFVQYVPITSACRECAEITKELRNVFARHPEIPMRWVQVQVSGRVGRPK